MLIVSRRTRANAHGIARSLLGLALVAAPFALQAPNANAQEGKPPQGPLGRQLDRVDFGIIGIGSLTKSTTGPITVTTAPNYPSSLTLTPSNTVGVMLNVRYIAKPWVGFEFNYTYARYTENYSYNPPGPIQANATEYSLGYVAHPQHVIAGVLHPFFGGGAGSTAFRPTVGGGQGLPVQARATYYYNVGVEAPVGSHFGLRAQFRQAFFLAPDFGQNYLTNLKRTDTIEPGAGFYLHF
ncbi:outer membrane beta-barrel protein [Granulicella sp. WH15]|uniref:outer membrane beta-barrel protein n=1 Tax=Granulicella sp. WH15 TaxID=2602070 RepID=UPI001366F534|nr:outer membrane beta-barrel protein [Granulicella sp. WH15]QHN04953.1 outer membrane beta-barrel protein [Granulicella sp. WH15]